MPSMGSGNAAHQLQGRRVRGQSGAPSCRLLNGSIQGVHGALEDCIWCIKVLLSQFILWASTCHPSLHLAGQGSLVHEVFLPHL